MLGQDLANIGQILFCIRQNSERYNLKFNFFTTCDYLCEWNQLITRKIALEN